MFKNVTSNQPHKKHFILLLFGHQSVGPENERKRLQSTVEKQLRSIIDKDWASSILFGQSARDNLSESEELFVTIKQRKFCGIFDE